VTSIIQAGASNFGALGSGGAFQVWVSQGCVQGNDEGNGDLVPSSTGSNICSNGYWISLQQLNNDFAHLNDAVLTARLNIGRNANDTYIWQLANQVNIYTSNPITACQFADVAIWAGSTALVPEAVVVPKGLVRLAWATGAAWGFKQTMIGGCGE